MYDRAPRLLRLAEGGSTEEHVGPTSYQVSFLKKQATDGYAPFLSLTARESTFTLASNIDKVAPGPGYYNVSKTQKISRAITISRRFEVPSIPSCGQSYGYDINEDGSIKKHFPPDSDSTLGPAYYKPQFNFSSATLKYKGIHFGNSLGRLQFPVKTWPGPGQYDIVQKKVPRYENINIKKDQKQDYCSYLPRFYEVIIIQEEKKRFLPRKSITPAPGTYNEYRTAFKPLKKTPALQNTPFGQSAARFMKDSRTEEMPGPGFYNVINNTIFDNLSDNFLKKQEKGAFGSSVPRTFPMFQKETFTTPGPAEYQVNRISDELPNLTNHYTAFLSARERNAKLSDLEIPAPGSYDVQKSYEMSQVKQNYMPPRNFAARIRHSSFLSTTPRCLGKVTEGPGPATYNPILWKTCSIPFCVKASERFKESKEITPGPATYEVCFPFINKIE
ncbi:PREDICTED: sperm-tail PG-rich repeat-containing protein 2 [Condylura cristata]|uniref:sperm-tail PG-rich repeat-containing protein 2 n=1 Tax=Condylura cristata TaxID=143302 RepID=UPI00033475BC|nr:PREDICTED: sperm-tail PG-rich repeat-containing protein 2 [Condylura cristata]